MMIERRASPRTVSGARGLGFVLVAGACAASVLAWYVLIKTL